MKKKKATRLSFEVSFMPLSRILFVKISYLDPQTHVNIVLSI